MIEQVISPIPKLKHRNTVITLADQDEFVTKYEATNDHLADNTVAELNTFATQVNQVKEQISTDSQAVTETIEETRLIKSQVEQIEKNTSQIKDETSEIKTEVEQIVGSIPQGTINDTTTAKTSVWSSEKVSEELKNAGGEVAFITHSFTANEELTIPLSRSVNGAIVGVQKEVPQTELVNEDWLVSSDEFEGELTSDVDLANTRYDGVYLDTSDTVINYTAMHFSSDGFKIFALDVSKDSIFEFSMSSPYDITSASYTGKSFNLNSQANIPYGFVMTPNGLSLYMKAAGGNVFKYNLTAPFDLATISYSGSSLTQESSGNYGLLYNADGTKIYNSGGTRIYQANLSTPYDIFTASEPLYKDFIEETNIRGLAFANEGYSLYLVGTDNDTVYEYFLSVAYDIATATYTNKSFYVNAQEANPTCILFDNNFKKMFIAGQNSKKTFQFDLGTSRNLTTSKTDTYQTSTSKTSINTSLWAELNQFIPTQTLNKGEINYSFSKDNKESFIVSNGTAERTIAKNDGGVWKYNSNVVFEAETFENASINDMNVALDEALESAITEKGFDISTASYSNKSFSVASQDTTPLSIAFSQDGLRMFVLGESNKAIYQYNLTTAFDISTANYSNKSFSVASQDSSPFGLFFSSDGLKMFVIGTTTDTVYQYNLTTAFDISTASFSNKSFSVASQDTAPLGVAFSQNGFKMFVIGNANKAIYQYSLITAFDVSTASYSNKSFSIIAQSNNNYQIAFSSNGLKLFVVGAAAYSILEYTLTTPFDISTTSYQSNFIVSSQDTAPRGLAFSSDGLKMFVVGGRNKSVFEYISFINQSQNIQPPTLFELDNNLNLAITMKSTGTSPTFSNMDINYDAFSKWQEATPNTDYQAWQQGDINNVYVKALSANNLKVRVM